MNREITKTVVSYVTDAAERINHYMAFKGMLDFIRKKCLFLSQFMAVVDKAEFSIVTKPCTLFVVANDAFEMPHDMDPEDYLLGSMVAGVIVVDLVEPGKIWSLKTKLGKEILLTKDQGQITVNGKAKVVKIYENFRDGSLFVMDQNFL